MNELPPTGSVWRKGDEWRKVIESDDLSVRYWGFEDGPIYTETSNWLDWSRVAVRMDVQETKDPENTVRVPCVVFSKTNMLFGQPGQDETSIESPSSRLLPHVFQYVEFAPILPTIHTVKGRVTTAKEQP